MVQIANISFESHKNKMLGKTLLCFGLLSVIVSSSAQIDINRDLAGDVKFSQVKLGAYMQQCIHFSSTYQIITDSNVKIEVFNNFQQIFVLLEQLQVSQTVINQIEFLAEQDIALLSSATLNMLGASSVILGTAYHMNLNMRNNTLDAIRPLFESFMNENTNEFNLKHNMYIAALLVTGNSLEAAVLTTLQGQSGPEVESVHALLQRCNDLVEFHYEYMTEQMVHYVQDFFEASNAVNNVISQIRQQNSE